MKKIGLPLLIFLLALLLFGASCAPGQLSAPDLPERSEPPASTPNVLPAETGALSGPESTPVWPVEMAQSALGKQLSVDPSSVQVASIQEVIFPDGCLGLPHQDEACTEALVPGFTGRAEANGIEYEFRLSREGGNFRYQPIAALAAREALAQWIAVDSAGVRLVNFEYVEWENDCLGIEKAGERCESVPTPGFVITLNFRGQEYVYHSDRNGAQLKLVEPAPGGTVEALVTWRGEVDGACRQAAVGAESVDSGACGSAMSSAELANETRSSAVRYFVDKYLPFEAKTPAGEVALNGRGQITATPAEQRMIAEWARLVAVEAWTGGEDTASLAVIRWQRSGGIAGFCDQLEIYPGGEVYAYPCQGAPANASSIWLNTYQLERLYAWLDNYAPAELHIKDSAIADGIDEELFFEGYGTSTMEDFALEEMLDFARDLYLQATTEASESDLQTGFAVLLRYLEDLAAGRYTDAILVYGGDYETLRAWNPIIDPGDGAALFEAGCTFNGLVCNLSVRNLVDMLQIEADRYRYLVELSAPDGELFALGPCCGADPEESPPITQFSFDVVRRQEQYSVVDLPVYVP